MQQNNGIHCKVSCDDQFRRFLFNGTEFTSLYNQVSRLLALDNNEFVLKYLDEEKDLITISSTEELAFALDFFKFRVLRLHVVKNTSDALQQPASPVAETTQPEGNEPHHWKRGGKCRRGGFNAHTMHEHHRRHLQEGEDGKKRCWESHKERMISKRDHFKTLLAEIPTDRQLTRDEQDRQRFLQSKVNCIEARLAKWDECKGKKEKKERKCARKWEKKQNKCRKDDRVLTDEQKDEIVVLKTQIVSMKPMIKGLKMQLNEKKTNIVNVQSKESADILKIEIVALKEQLQVLKMTIQPLKQRIRDIKFN